MVEKFLADLFRVRRKQKIAIIIDGAVVSSKVLESLSVLVEKLREIGEIKIAQVISDVKSSEKDHTHLQESGFTEIVVPGNLELNLLLDIYDLVLSDKSIDIVVLGTHRRSLLPLYTELRKQVTILAFVCEEKMSKSFEESFDAIIHLDTIEEFTFQSSDFSEFENIVTGTNGGSGELLIGNDIVDDANIGIMSEDLIEKTDFEEARLEGNDFHDGPSDEQEIVTDKVEQSVEKKEAPKKKKKKKTTKKSKLQIDEDTGKQKAKNDTTLTNQEKSKKKTK
jgi:uncharacterized protein (TIGR00288 family)